MGMMLASYTLIFWGYTLIKGYGITLGEIVVPGRFKGTWPPASAPAGIINSSDTLPGTTSSVQAASTSVTA